MNSRERIQQTLSHREPDRIPFDLGGTGLSTIHVTAYRRLRRYLGLSEVEPNVAFIADLVRHKDWVGAMLDRLVEFKSAYWERALAEIGDLVDIVVEADDLGGQHAPLMSPRTYRQVIKPWHKRLFSFIKAQVPVKVFYHTCGAVRPLIPDLIEAGVDILNPVQIGAADMDPRELKREFGRDLVFWGGGVDTQSILGTATPAEIKDHVRRNMEALASDGGFVFAAVHDIQANVPPENIMAMWEAWHEYASYEREQDDQN